MFILMILYDFRLLPAQFCYIILYIRKAESRVQIADLVSQHTNTTVWNFPYDDSEFETSRFVKRVSKLKFRKVVKKRIHVEDGKQY
jgi:hypothetical protein